MTAITDKKLRDRIMKEKTLELKKMIELIKQNTYDRNKKKYTIPEALISTKEKHKKRRTDSENGKIRNKTEE